MNLFDESFRRAPAREVSRECDNAISAVESFLCHDDTGLIALCHDALVACETSPRAMAEVRDRLFPAPYSTGTSELLGERLLDRLVDTPDPCAPVSILRSLERGFGNVDLDPPAVGATGLPQLRIRLLSEGVVPLLTRFGQLDLAFAACREAAEIARCEYPTSYGRCLVAVGRTCLDSIYCGRIATQTIGQARGAMATAIRNLTGPDCATDLLAAQAIYAQLLSNPLTSAHGLSDDERRTLDELTTTLRNAAYAHPGLDSSAAIALANAEFGRGNFRDANEAFELVPPLDGAAANRTAAGEYHDAAALLRNDGRSAELAAVAWQAAARPARFEGARWRRERMLPVASERRMVERVHRAAIASDFMRNDAISRIRSGRSNQTDANRSGLRGRLIGSRDDVPDTTVDAAVAAAREAHDERERQLR